MDERASERLASLPPSAKLVYYVLDAEGRLDQTGLAAETRLSTRTVRFAVEKLSAAELVDEGFCPTDARRSVYETAPGPDSESDPDPTAAVRTAPVDD
ncbi:helix-turn-helix domain-containing protein [Halorubrum sp. JWXQ-INN 858]|uniref:helix-turn-helix domain-containing protein n=1 Tax=Halorubrum sp. JWXQ-INN 858 TaxID=2690782 RepID=UPI001F382AF8|nr:helix-turn-helix domain-containing protein [Halorubrum sp. JWXQ-INN 858]